MSENLSVEEIAAQFLERRDAGETLDTEEFIAAYPEYADELRDLLGLMADMDRVKPDRTQKMTPADSAPARTNLPDSDYRLVRKLGSGGMGVVFEAVQVSLNRKVAVKLLDSSLLPSAEQRTQFENEAKVIAMLHHPNIVKIYSAGCSEERCYYAMELVEGKGLDSCRFTDVRELAKIALQAAQALSYAHKCGVLHRDIKPANMLLDAAGEVHISDFGIAFILSGNEPVVEKEGSRSGTLRYMAPERLSKGVNTFATDQYAFGAAFWELAAGRPFLQADSREALAGKICSGDVEPLSCGEAEFAAILNKCIRFRPEDRYKGMEEVAADLRRFLNHEPVRAFSSSVRHRFVLWCRRKPAVAALTFAALFCAGAFVFSLALGYVRTKRALRLAEENALVADSALSRIFRRVSEQPPSRKNTELLTELLPYYQTIVRQRGTPGAKMEEACAILGECALRSGDYVLAEKAFRRLMKYHSDAYGLNRLAAVLKKRGQTEQADKLSRQVVSKFENSQDEKDRFEVVRALLALSTRPDSPERSLAFRILESLLKEKPDHAEYRFLYAVLLGANPRLFHSLRIPGVEPNAAVLLSSLADAHPDNPEYSLALVELMLRRFRMRRNMRDSRDSLDDAIFISERMLGRWPNDPQIVSAAVKLHSRYISSLFRRGGGPNALKGNERLLGILEILSHNPEYSDAIREELIQLQLNRIAMIRRRGAKKEEESLRRKIENELQHYRGPKLEDFRRQLEENGKDKS
ncbi:MAG: protein kinase, partial [Lentisphaeria bacterium]|nr:protein kinase [Lentisphaeria bacterium]